MFAVFPTGLRLLKKIQTKIMQENMPPDYQNKQRQQQIYSGIGNGAGRRNNIGSHCTLKDFKIEI